MPDQISHRFTRAVSILDIQPNDHLLEIGCGHGIAVGLICLRLLDGSITAIDRSSKMIEKTRLRNKDHMKAGKAAFHAEALDAVSLSPASFNKIFAINVNVFWQNPRSELSDIHKLLVGEGRLYLFYQPPVPEKADIIQSTVKKNLDNGGFAKQEAEIELHDGDALLYLIAAKC